VPEKDEQALKVRQLQGVLRTVREANQAVQKQLSELQNFANAVVADSVGKNGFTTWKLEVVLSEVKEGVGSAWRGYPVLGATRGGLAPAKEPPGKNPERYKRVTAVRSFITRCVFCLDQSLMSMTTMSPGSQAQTTLW